MSNATDASSPPRKKRTLQIKLGRPKPSSASASSSTPSVDHNGFDKAQSSSALRISLKRKPSFPEHQYTRPAFPRAVIQDSEDEEAVEVEEAVEDGDSASEADPLPSRTETIGDEDDEEEEDYDMEDDTGAEHNADGVQRTGTSSLRPIKKLREKGLYDALPQLIENLIRRDSYRFFCEPVNPEEVPGYLDVIQEPMDFGTMYNKVQKRQYSHMEQFKADFWLVISNAQTFNPPGSLYYNEAKRIGNWGGRAIEREGMAINDNGKAGGKTKQSSRAAQYSEPSISTATEVQQAPAPQRYSQHIGIEAVMKAARLKPHVRQKAAIALGLNTAHHISNQQDANADDDDMDEDDSDDEQNDDPRASVVRESRERSQTLDNIVSANRFGSSQPGATPTTPSGYRLASPELRKQLAAVNAASIPVQGTGRLLSKHIRQKHRLAAAGTPRRLEAKGTALPTLSGPLASIGQSSSIAACSFDDDGSINAELLEDLPGYVAMQKPILMPIMESLHAVAFVPNEYSGKAAAAGRADDEDDDDEDGKGDSKDKGDKDPLGTLPPSRPGVPDVLYSAIAPQPEELGSVCSHDMEGLPPNLRHLPFQIPSGHPSKPLSTPSLWINDAYEEALINERRPRKQRDREREKEREMTDDWTYFRPRLARFLEVTDLGPMSTLATQKADLRLPLSAELLSSHRQAQLRAELERKTSDPASSIVTAYAGAVRDSRAITESERQTLANVGSDIIGDAVYGGVMGKAYCRSLAEFVGGAVTSPFLTDAADDARTRAQQDARLQQEALTSTQKLLRDRSASPADNGMTKEIGSRRGPFLWRDSPDDDTPMQQDTRSPTPQRQFSSEPVPHPTVKRELQALDCALLEFVEQKVIRQVTGGTIDILHLVESLDASNGKTGDILQRLQHSHISAHTLDRGSAPAEGELAWLNNDPALTKLLDEARQDVDSLGSIIKYVVSNA